MIITFTNVIGAIRTAFSVVRSGLKMWLGFETSETLGIELVDNGDFSDGTTGWQGSDAAANISISNNRLRLTNGDSSAAGVVNSTTTKISFKNGSSYQISYESYQGTSTNKNSQLFLGTTQSGGSSADKLVGEVFTTDGIHKQNFTSTSNQELFLTIKNGITTSGIYMEFDNISVKELTQITPDKSGNNNVGELFTGKALEFDGSNDKVDIDFTTQIKSAVFWVKPLDTGVQSILGFGGAFSGSKYIKSVNNNIQSAGLSSVSVYVNGVSTTSVPVNQWSRVVVNFALLTPQELTFGYGFDTYGYIQLSDVQLYDENLSTDDIAYDYANPNKLAIDNPSTSLSVTNLKGYWAMSEGAGSLTYDSSGEGNNGTINGATYEPAQPRIPQLGMQNWSKGSNLFPYSEDFTEWIINSGTSQVVLAASEAAPYGQGDVYSIIMQASESDAYIRYATTNATLTSSTHSVWVKQAPTGSATHIRITNNNRAAWNTGTSEKIALTSSWQRLETTDSITGNRFTIIGSADASGTQDSDCLGKALIYGAQLLEGSSAGAYRLTDGGATLNSTVIPNPTIPTQDIFGNLVRDRLNSFNLDGSGYATNETLPTISGNISLSFWVKLDTFVSGNLGQVVGKREGSSWLRVYRPYASNLRLEVAAGQQYTFPVTENQWVYVAITINSSNQASVYVDDSAASGTTLGTSFSFINTEVFTVGAWLNPALQPTSKLNGLVSDVLIYDRVLTVEEVENNYNAGLSAHTNN